MVLVVTEADDVTADLVITELNRRRNSEVVRVDPGDFPHQVCLVASVDTDGGRWQGTLATTSRRVELADVTAVYWRRPSAYRFPGLDVQDTEFAAAQAREGFGGVLASLRCRYVNHPHRNWAAEYKPAQLTVAAEIGFTIPPTLITSDADAARAFARKHAPVVYKPLRLTDLQLNGTPQTVWTQRVKAHEIGDSVSRTAHLFQAEVLDKAADLRVTVVGRRVFCVRIESASRLLDWRSDYNDLSYPVVEPDREFARRLRGYLKRFGLRFGCFDFAVAPDGTPYFLECNPNGQWAWMEPPTGLPMTAAFADALEGDL